MAKSRKSAPRVGRRPSTTRSELSDVGIELLSSKGFEETSVDDIADAAGIARRTFFRYFPSKNAVPWGDFDTQLAALRAHLNGLPADIELADGLRSALLQFNTFPEEAAVHRQRMALILSNPALQSYSMVMYEGTHPLYTGLRTEDHAASRPVERLRAGRVGPKRRPYAVAWERRTVSASRCNRRAKLDLGDLAPRALG
ncbi:TetR family transcriptional regulator [Gordonia polyisoprenivorans]|uniref:TetR family transcriptional regulator n=1 Tax=Gordonia polyisoprenivorans TaxID=84595 RepID=UPI001FCC6A68|nr:TetR family transcriptional regulator [Gordonia polyisoprenivorans]